MNLIRPTFVFLILFSLLLGGLYPLVTTGFASAIFSTEAEGSVLHDRHGKTVGSSLIGQNFSDPKFFWGRLSATSPNAYNASSSSGSNLGSNNPNLLENAKARIAALRSADPTNTHEIPVDLVTASGSGLDPHISIAAAEYQIPRVARLRGMNELQMRSYVSRYTEGRQFGVLGEPVVNVLKLNLALEGRL